MMEVYITPDIVIWVCIWIAVIAFIIGFFIGASLFINKE